MSPTSSRLATPALRRICANAAFPRILQPRNPRLGRFIAAAAAAMPPKRKRAESHPPPPRPEPPRRSTRVARDVPEPEYGASGPPQEKSARQKKADDAWASREAVERAMLDLSEMEQKLQDGVRRQRLAVESSDFSVHTNAAAETASHTTSKLAAKELVPETSKDKPSTRTVEQLLGDELDGDQDHGPEVAVKEDSQDRCARRPPPVHSEKLPLPWSGRLGYVRTPRKQIRGWPCRPSGVPSGAEAN